MNVKIYSFGPGAKKRMIAPNGANIPVHVEKALSIIGPNDINNTYAIQIHNITDITYDRVAIRFNNQTNEHKYLHLSFDNKIPRWGLVPG